MHEMQPIFENNRRFVEAYNRGDAAGCAEAYTENARILPPDAPMMQGRQAIQAFWHGAMDMGIRSVALETVDFEAAGDTVGREIGTAVLTIETPDGQTVTQHAKYVVVWKRQDDGSWKWDTDIWNSSPTPNA